MINLASLQSRLEEKARKRASDDSTKEVSSLTFFGDIEIYPVGGDKLIKLDGWTLRQKVQHAIEEVLYAKYLRQETERLLSAVDQIEEIASTVDNIQRGN